VVFAAINREKMMANTSQQHELAEEIAKVRQQYLESLPTKASDINALWNELIVSGWSKGKVTTLGFELHSLSGSGQTFGFPQISELAKLAEKELDLLYAEKDSSTEQLEKIGQSIKLLTGLILDKNAETGANESYIPLAHKPIYILIQDKQQSRLLNNELIKRDYNVKQCDSVTQLNSSIKRHPPGLVILDLDYIIQDEQNKNILSHIRHNQTTYTPTLFISVENSIEARLAAVKLGGDAFYPSDFKIKGLLDKIDKITARFNAEPYRVLLVDDDKVLSQVYQMFLDEAGLIVKTINNPLKILSEIVDFEPDIILLDNEMPQCSGLELARLLKQHDAHYKLPVIFLTADQSQETAFKAREFGADDFLTKPIQEDYLIASVVNHAQKARMFNQEASLDSMTGLLSHEMFEVELQRQLKQLTRTKQPLCFAMLDLDNFKQINDQFGHLMGDTVLKGFANLLKEKLRSSDFIGRYGGEEFAILFPCTHMAEATKTLDRVRIEYQALKHISGSQNTFNTVSIGLSETNGERSYLELIDSADRALYKAKSTGKNKLEIDPSSA
jgi:diguanylate cyclase (GGDEF)-like protein